MTLISLGNFSFSLIFPLTIPIPVCFRLLLIRQMTSFIFAQHPLLLIFFMFVGESLLGLLGLSKRIKTEIKSESTRIIIKDNSLTDKKEITHILPVEQNKRKSTYAFIAVITLFDLISTIGKNITSNVSNPGLKIVQNEMKIVELFYTISFSYFILHHHLYKHQFISLLIFIIGILILFIPTIMSKLVGFEELIINFS